MNKKQQKQMSLNTLKWINRQLDSVSGTSRVINRILAGRGDDIPIETEALMENKLDDLKKEVRYLEQKIKFELALLAQL
jgi:hypothetical protein